MPEGEKGDIESVLNVDSALKYIAANTVLGNYDSYNGNMAQNYYLYGQDGNFTVIPGTITCLSADSAEAENR